MDKMKKLINSRWFKSRPENVRKSILRYPPYFIYINKPTGYLCAIYSYTESKDGSCNHCQIIVSYEANKDNIRIKGKVFEHPLTENRIVFGIPFSDLKRLKEI